MSVCSVVNGYLTLFIGLCIAERLSNKELCVHIYPLVRRRVHVRAVIMRYSVRVFISGWEFVFFHEYEDA